MRSSDSLSKQDTRVEAAQSAQKPLEHRPELPRIFSKKANTKKTLVVAVMVAPKAMEVIVAITSEIQATAVT